jgi:hypothetical protein
MNADSEGDSGFGYFVSHEIFRRFSDGDAGTIAGKFGAGRDYPLWSVDNDVTGTTDHIATDVRGPYGAMNFNNAAFPAVTALRWGDWYHFVGDLYNAFLRRGGDVGGMLFWIDLLNRNVLTRDQVRQQFRVSPEFNARVTAVVAQGCVGG